MEIAAGGGPPVSLRSVIAIWRTASVTAQRVSSIMRATAAPRRFRWPRVDVARTWSSKRRCQSGVSWPNKKCYNFS